MFDIGGSELLVIGVVALIVVGPKDLPGMFHTLGRFTAKARSMAREFSRAMDDAAKESGVKDVAKDLKGMTSAKSLGLDKVNQAVGKFEAWDPLKKAPQKSDEGKTADTKPKGPATQALSEDRAAAKAKIEAATAKRATERKVAEAAKAAAPADAVATVAKPAKIAKPAKTAAKSAAKPAAKAAPVKAPAKAPAKAARKPAVKAASAKTAAKPAAKASPATARKKSTP